ncbi:MAG: autotransporter-associated beta strand repeat-containing protein [Xanthomonadales bacterium]|nr:autotransporter-associated beta strand repeat-containing protein [Xanthomonadales bacterium]
MFLLRTFVLIFISLNVYAGGDLCETQASGNWSDPATWTNCSGSYPSTSAFATIKNGHTVALDINITDLNSVVVEAGGDFDVANDASGLILGGSTFNTDFDFTEASMDLFGDFEIDASAKVLELGPIDGYFDFFVSNATLTRLNSDIGSTTALKSFTVDDDDMALGANVIINTEVFNVFDFVDLGAFNLTINNSFASSISFDVSGSGNLIKKGTGTLTLDDNNTLTGNVEINEGTLILTDTTNNNPVASSSNIILSTGAILNPQNIANFEIKSGQTLSGAGTVSSGLSVANGSTIFPKYDSTNMTTGVIAASDFLMDTGSQFRVDINGNANGDQYGQLSATGAVFLLGSPSLNLTATNATAGTEYLIIDNDGADPVLGTFDSLSEGSTIITGNNKFVISYVGGDGNDVVLTETTCHSVQDGLWSSPATWTSCIGAVPSSVDKVQVLNAVELDVNATVESLVVGNSGDFDVAASAGGLTLEVTSDTLNFQDVDVTLSGDFTIVNTNNEVLLAIINGDYNLTINSNQRVWFAGSYTSNLKSLTTDAGGHTRISNTRVFNLSGDNNTVFNDNLSIGASARITMNQTGSGNLIFEDDITRTSGSPHKITLNNDTGETQIKGIVDVGELNTGGTANVVISGGSLTTTKGGANSANMTFNSPVVIAADTVFTVSTTTSGTLTFNNTLNDDGNGWGITMNCPNSTILSSIGNSTMPASLTTDAGGTTVLSGTIYTSNSITINDNLLLNNNSEFGSIVVDVAGDTNVNEFTLTIDNEDIIGQSGIDGVVSGTGQIVKTGNGYFNFFSVNTLSGSVVINDGNIVNQNVSENIFPDVVTFLTSSGATASLASTSTGVFKLNNNQTIKGYGYLTGIVDREQSSTATISPGFSPGQLTFDTLRLDENASVDIEINGLIAGTDYDQIIINNNVALGYDLDNGASLNVTLGYSPTLGDSFMIIDNQGAQSVSDSFIGLFEGAEYLVDGNVFTISYVGGDGNDVVLTMARQVKTIYVNSAALVGGDGLTWPTAYTSLQDGLAIGQLGDEIWVAQGVYYPDEGSSQVDNDQNETFTLIPQVSIYGGFIGTETDREQRNPLTQLTILSGDIQQDDVNTDGNNVAETVDDIVGSNSYNILTGSNVTTITYLDGFTITSGSAAGASSPTDRGAGIHCGNDTSGPSLNQMTFIGNYSLKRGSGVFGCSQMVTNSSFINNETNDLGSAVYAIGGQIDNVYFSGNKSKFTGGAVRNNTNPLYVLNSVFEANESTDLRGGALITTSDLYLENVLFKGNRSSNSGGALRVEGSTADLVNVTMTGNRTNNLGGAISINDTATLNITNSIIWNNQDTSGVGTASASIDVAVGGVLNNSNSLIQSYGTTGTGNLDEDPLFVTDTDPSTAPTSDGNAHLLSVSPVIGAGDNSVVTQSYDLDGGERILYETVDMGAYEYNDVIFANGFE